MKELATKSEFTAATAKGVSLLDFWAPWCGPCKVLTPVLEVVSQEHPEVSFFKINADSDLGQNLGSTYGISSLPTMVILEDGVKKRTLIGNTSKAKIVDFLNGK